MYLYSLNMSKIQLLRVFLNDRLTAAADEIFGVVEKMIAEYQEEVVRLQRLLDIVLQPEIPLNLHRADFQQLTLSEAEIPPEQQHYEQEWSHNLGLEDPETIQFKDEEEELRTSQEEEQIQRIETVTKDDIFTPACVKSDCVEYPTQLSNIYQAQKEGNKERDTLPSTTTEQIKTEPDGEDYRESEPTSVSQPPLAVNPVCSAVQSGMENKRPPSGFKQVKSKRTEMVKGQRSRINTKGKKSTQLSLLKSSSQGHATPCCKVCGKYFHYMGSLIKHVQTHTKDKETLCGVCGKHMESTEGMKEHLQTHIAARLCCHVCGKWFSKNSKLTVHMRSHTGEKPFSCPVCGTCFMQTGDLKRHMRTHTGEKPYLCPDCGKGFSVASNLSVHIKIHTGEKGEPDSALAPI
ncbi:uncharacterized protein ACWYII_041733 [Salvelinus alpinus]|uniref:gastrula zinc finger protein XlCGF48.2-like n=1 Tax=Salvelinus alpinus TaxID=8036 RepID=UPI0039FD186F